jgi:hypothetical protein
MDYSNKPQPDALLDQTALKARARPRAVEPQVTAINNQLWLCRSRCVRPGPSLGRARLPDAHRQRQKPTASELFRAVGFVSLAGERDP